MKNILVIVGAGNKFGNTSHLSDAFIQGATEAGNVVDKVILSQDIQGCKGDIKNKSVPETFLEEAYLLGKSIK